MASIAERQRRDGTTSFQVRWRQDGRWQSETFATRRAARRFVVAVTDAGGRWPAGWIPGLGYEVTGSAPGTAPAQTAQPAGTGATPFLEFADRYLNTRTAVSDYQLTRYRSEVGRLAPHFPVVEAIDDEAVAAWVRAMRAAGRSPKTIANYHGLLYAICGYAVRKGLLVANPCVDTQLPHRSSFDAEGAPIACFLEPEEFALIAEAMCASSAYQWRPPGGRGQRRLPAQIPSCGIAFREDRDLITLAVHTGLRWGEISALRVGDLDLARRTLSVARAWKRDGTGAWVIGPPKTARSRRTISLAPSVAEMLAGHLDGRALSEYVFVNGDGGPLRQAHFYEDRWQRAVRLARTRGLTKNPRFHDLRHTHVAWLIAGNTPLPKIQARLGHESIQTTIDVYGGLLRHTDAQVDGVSEAMFSTAAGLAPPAQERHGRATRGTQGRGTGQAS